MCVQVLHLSNFTNFWHHCCNWFHFKQIPDSEGNFSTAMTVLAFESYKMTLDCAKFSSSLVLLSNEFKHHKILNGSLSQPLTFGLWFWILFRLLPRFLSSFSIFFVKLFDELDSCSLVKLEDELIDDNDIEDSETFLTLGKRSWKVKYKKKF